MEDFLDEVLQPGKVSYAACSYIFLFKYLLAITMAYDCNVTHMRYCSGFGCKIPIQHAEMQHGKYFKEVSN
jgi:hypothetical protein